MKGVQAGGSSSKVTNTILKGRLTFLNNFLFRTPRKFQKLHHQLQFHRLELYLKIKLLKMMLIFNWPK